MIADKPGADRIGKQKRVSRYQTNGRADNFRVARRSAGISLIVSDRLPISRLLRSNRLFSFECAALACLRPEMSESAGKGIGRMTSLLWQTDLLLKRCEAWIGTHGVEPDIGPKTVQPVPLLIGDVEPAEGFIFFS